MKHIPLGASVDCADGLCGQSTCVIVDPESFQVTHFAVKQTGGTLTDRLVPVSKVKWVTSDSIQLDCTTAELADMAPFTTSEFREVEVPRYIADGYSTHYYVPEITRVPVETQHVPKGQYAVAEGAEVLATDGPVGRVDELWVDPVAGNVTHLILKEDHVWGDKDVIIPMSMIQMATSETVRLKVDRHAVATLLAIPLEERQRVEDMELIVYILDSAKAAQELWRTLKPLATRHPSVILNAALLVKEQDGTASIREIEDIGPRRGTLFGAITGGLIGLVGGPIGAVVGAATGALTGRAASTWIDMGFPDEYLRKLQAGLQPGTSAVISLVDSELVDEIAEVLRGFGGQLLRQPLSEDLEAALFSPRAVRGDDVNVENEQ